MSVVYLGSQRVAMGTGAGVTYLHGDHPSTWLRTGLGSTSVTSGASGVNKQWYYAYGAVRASDGTLPTDYTFTGQKADSYIKLVEMGARRYDADLGRFVQPDSIIPDWYNPQSLNRYAYVLNNPVKYTDPTGYSPVEEDTEGNDYIDTAWRDKQRVYEETGKIIFGHATVREIRIIEQVLEMFPPIKGSVVAVSRDPRCGSRGCLEGGTYTGADAEKAGILGNVLLNAAVIKNCAAGKGQCGQAPRDDFEKRFLYMAAHEFAHSAASGNDKMRQAYAAMWDRNRFAEPTDYGTTNPDEGLAEFVALAVTNPAGTKGYNGLGILGLRYRLRWDSDDPGIERRAFIHSFFPGIPGVPQ